MPELSQDEKDKIRSEMEYRETIRRLIEQPRDGWSKFSTFFAHPAIVTVIGGILITIIGSWFQYHYNSEQNKAARLKQILDKKIVIASIFPVQFHKDATLLVNVCDKKLFLSTKKQKDCLGQTRSEVKLLYNKFFDEYIKSGQQASLLSEVRAWYCDPSVIGLAASLDNMVEQLENLDAKELSDKKIQDFDKNAEVKVRELTKAMVDEVRANRVCESALTTR